MKTLSVFSLFIFLLSACDISTKYSNHQIEETLNERYGEEFKVTENHFVFNIQHHQFTAVLKENSEVTVHSTYGKDGGEINENYPQMLRSYQAYTFFLSRLKQYYPTVKIKSTVYVHSGIEDAGNTEIPNFEKLMRDSASEVEVDASIYIFETVKSDDKEKGLAGILALAKEVTNWKNKNFYFNIYFWDENHFKGKDIEKLNFGFNVYNETYYDNLAIENEFLKEVIYMEFDTKTGSEPITIDRLFESIRPYDNGRNPQEETVYF